LFAAEILLLHASPVYYGFGVPHGDDSGVVIIPGFLATDLYLMELHGWLGRIGYRPYFSGIGINADCPNLLIQRNLNQTVERALEDTGRKIHLIGHSLGGILARSLATRHPELVASVITLGSPFRGIRSHPFVLLASDRVRAQVRRDDRPDCYTGYCRCPAVSGLEAPFPTSVPQLAVFTRTDGIVDWRVCVTDDAAANVEVAGTHVGLVANPGAYRAIAHHLAAARRPAATTTS